MLPIVTSSTAALRLRSLAPFAVDKGNGGSGNEITLVIANANEICYLTLEAGYPDIYRAASNKANQMPVLAEAVCMLSSGPWATRLTEMMT